jgi:hypothetical protein
MKCLRDEMEIVNAYELVGSYRGAAALCGTTAKTVKRVLERRVAGQVGRRPSPARVRNTAAVVELIRQKVPASDGRISAKRVLPTARTAGYAGSTRNFRRAVAEAKAKKQRRTYRPWVPLPGQYLVIDWVEEAGRNVFCAVLAWSRVRFSSSTISVPLKAHNSRPNEHNAERTRLRWCLRNPRQCRRTPDPG